METGEILKQLSNTYQSGEIKMYTMLRSLQHRKEDAGLLQKEIIFHWKLKEKIQGILLLMPED
jgi:hypothetical protein